MAASPQAPTSVSSVVKLAFHPEHAPKEERRRNESGAACLLPATSKANPSFGVCVLTAALGAAGRHHGVGHQAGVGAHGLLDCRRHLGIVLEELLGVLAALADALAIVGEPGAGLLHDARLHTEIQELATLGDALAVHDVELDHLERRRHLVLDHLDAGLVADHLLALLDGADAPDVEPDGCIELERVAAGGGL